MPDDIATLFLARLWELQAAENLSDAELARRIGASAGYISRLRNGRRGGRVTLEFAMRAATAFSDLRPFLSFDVLPGNTVEPSSTDKEPS